MEDYKDNHSSEHKFQKTRTSFRPGQKQNRPNRLRDRQKGLVTAFVQGKGQNAALKWLMDSRTPVSVFLITGVKFEGLVSAFDAFTISITDVKRHQQMIYKDKISTITIKRPDSASSHKPSSHREDILEPGVSRPLNGDDSSDDGVTLPEHPVNYTGSM